MAKNESELQRLRGRFGLTRRQVSDLLNISEMTVFRIERSLNKNHHPHITKKLELLTEVLRAKEQK